MAPEVFFTVCHGTKRSLDKETIDRYDFKPAILNGYCRRRVRGEDYPGMMADEKHSTRGTLVTGLTKDDIRNLDRFEGPDYDRITVKARVLEKVTAESSVDKSGEDGKAPTGAEGSVEGEEVECMTYVFKHSKYLEDREWDFVEFREQKLKKWTRYDFVFDGMSALHPAVRLFHQDLPFPAEALDESNRQEEGHST